MPRASRPTSAARRPSCWSSWADRKWPKACCGSWSAIEGGHPRPLDHSSAWPSLDRGRGDDALRSFERALEIDPKQALALSGLGTLHLTLFRQRQDRQSLRRAGEFFSRALAVDDQLITALNGLGAVRLYLGDSEEAIRYFRRALASDPEFVNTYFNLAIAQLRINRRGAARQTLATLAPEPTSIGFPLPSATSWRPSSAKPVPENWMDMETLDVRRQTLDVRR